MISHQMRNVMLCVYLTYIVFVAVVVIAVIVVVDD